MPTYDFRCDNCKHKFSLVMTLSERDKGDVACPKCKGKEVRQLVTSFIAQTSKKS